MPISKGEVRQALAGAVARSLPRLIAMTQALGAGTCLWVLPLADLGIRAWRILYLIPLAYLAIAGFSSSAADSTLYYVGPGSPNGCPATG